MPTLSERATELIQRPYKGSTTVFTTDPVAEILAEACLSIESLTEANHALAAKQEASELRIEELEAQVAQLAPPNDIGPIIKSAWKPLSNSDLNVVNETPSVRPPGW